MQALTMLRAHLLDVLKIKSENLITFVENGSVFTVPKKNQNSNDDFEVKYQGVVYLLNCNVDARYICFIIGEWMNIYQPSRPQDHTQITFDADIKSHEDADMEFTINFTEEVCVKIEGEGESREITITSCFPDLVDEIPGVVIRER